MEKGLKDKSKSPKVAPGVSKIYILITCHLPTNRYIDHGAIFYENGERPTYVNSIAAGKNGEIYTLARFQHQGKVIQDLVKITSSF